jgi:hypothetical protein
MNEGVPFAIGLAGDDIRRLRITSYKRLNADNGLTDVAYHNIRPSARVTGRAFASERHIGKGKVVSYARTLPRPLVKAGGPDAHANALSHNCKEPGVTLMLLMSRGHRDMSALLLSTDPPVCRKQAGVFLLVVS